MQFGDQALAARQRIEAGAILQVLARDKRPVRFPTTTRVIAIVAKPDGGYDDVVIRGCELGVDFRIALRNWRINLLEEHWAAAYFDSELDRYVICGGNHLATMRELTRRLIA